MGKEHLEASGWKVVNKKGPSIDGRKLLKALEDYEKITRGEDFAGQVKALDEIEAQVYTLEKQKDKPTEIEKYLEQIEKQLKSDRIVAREELRLKKTMEKGPRPSKEKDEEEGEDEGDGGLETALKMVKSRKDDLDRALQFVACVGKPYAIALARKVGTKHKKAVRQRNKGTKLIVGKCIYESSAYTFVLDAKPPGGLAKQLKAGLYDQVGKNFRVRVRDMDNTATLDDETDELPPEDRPVQGTPASKAQDIPEGRPGSVRDAARRLDASAAQSELDKFVPRLKTLAKTVAYGLKQAPDEAVRVLTNVRTEIDRTVRGLTARNGDLTMPPAVEVLRRNIDAGVREIAERTKQLATEHAKEWLERLNPLIRRDATPTSKELLEAVTHIEGEIKLDEAMLVRLKLPPPALYEQIRARLVQARARYTEGFPVRVGSKDPESPPKANRPALGDKGGPFKELVDRSEGAMAQGNQPNLDDLRQMVTEIEGALPTNLKQALKDTYKTWDKVKDHYKDLLKENRKDEAAQFMSGYWWFRRMTVDKLMADLQAKYDFKWASVGSANPESDYDISISSHGKQGGKIVYDWQIVNEFNKTISREYGCQPGTLFDTNLYASAKVAPPVSTDDAGLSEPVRNYRQAVKRDMGAMTEAGQDVGALMKMRRYMDWESFESYKNGILAEMEKAVKQAPDRTVRKQLFEQVQTARRQFEEADGLYFMSLYKQLVKAGLKPPEDLSPAGQKQLLKMAHDLEHDGDKLMETNNDLYVEAMVEVREVEERLAGTPESDEAGRAALFARLKTAQADATFFAAEAYHSEGPFKHIVDARQSSDAKVKNDPVLSKLPAGQQAEKVAELTKAAIDAMSVGQMMQSFNENLGDLLKDLRHYAEKSDLPAMGFFRSSKYFERFCDAMDIMGQKLAASPTSKEYGALKIAGKTPAEMRGALAKLVQVRGGAGFKSKADNPGDENAYDDPEKEKDAFVIAEMRRMIPSVATLSDLAAEVTAVGAQVNAVLRKAEVGASMQAKSEKAYFG